MKFIYPIEKKKDMALPMKVLNILLKKCEINFTVDCGTLSFEAIELHKNNVDVIVLDHHQSEIKLPKAFSIM